MFNSKISTSQLIRVCQRIGMGLRAGLPMRKVWEGEAHRGSGKQRQVMQAIYDHIAEGDTVSDAMKDSAAYFPRLVVAMVEIGEHTGRLETVFLKLADHYEHQQKLARQFLFGIAWPAIQLSMAVTLFGLLIYVFGLVAAVAGGDPVDITGLGLTGFSGMIQYFFWVGVSVAYIGGMLYAFVHGWFGPTPMRIATYIPVIGPCLSQMAMSRLCWSLGMALDAGIDAKRSVELAIDSTQNPFYVSRAPHVLAEIHAGNQFYESFRDAGGFPQDYLDLLEAAEISGTLSEALVRMSTDYDDQARRSMQVITSIASFLVWAGVAVMLVLMILRMAMIYLNALNSALEGF
jgi:type IV pilus assembly protein PilC